MATLRALTDTQHHRDLGLPPGLPYLQATEPLFGDMLDLVKPSGMSNEPDIVAALRGQAVKFKYPVSFYGVVYGVGPGAFSLAPLVAEHGVLVMGDIAPSLLRTYYLLAHTLLSGSGTTLHTWLQSGADLSVKPPHVGSEVWAVLHAAHDAANELCHGRLPNISLMGTPAHDPLLLTDVKYGETKDVRWSCDALCDPATMRALETLVRDGRILFVNMDCLDDEAWGLLSRTITASWPQAAQDSAYFHLSNLPAVLKGGLPKALHPVSPMLVDTIASGWVLGQGKSMTISWVRGDRIEEMSVQSISFQTPLDLRAAFSASGLNLGQDYVRTPPCVDYVQSFMDGVSKPVKIDMAYAESRYGTGKRLNVILSYGQQKSIICSPTGIQLLDPDHRRCIAPLSVRYNESLRRVIRDHAPSLWHIDSTPTDWASALFPLALCAEQTMNQLDTMSPQRGFEAFETFVRDTATRMTWPVYVDLLIWASRKKNNFGKKMMGLLVQKTGTADPISSLCRFYYQVLERPETWPEAMRHVRSDILANHFT